MIHDAWWFMLWDHILPIFNLIKLVIDWTFLHRKSQFFIDKTMIVVFKIMI